MMGRKDNIRFERATRLLEAEVAGELVALDQERGTCFGFNAVATEVWRLLETTRSVIDLRKALVARYEVSDEECAADIWELLGELEAAGLIRRVGPSRVN